MDDNARPHRARIVEEYLEDHGNANEEDVDLARQINLEVDNDDVQELLDFHNQELRINWLIELHKQVQTLKRLSIYTQINQKIECEFDRGTVKLRKGY
ncbi:hypothetical protein TNCV_67281 [Trichonephila clavipes]|nr:hypothetical protein TNCV_67281 [Trichonephila clavipes]